MRLLTLDETTSDRHVRERAVTVGIGHVCMGRGGSEARAMWGIEALCDEYDVSLVTAGRVLLDELNCFYGTDLSPADFTVREAWTPWFMKRADVGAALRGYLYQRFCMRVAGEFDILISAYNLCDFGVPAIHFVADFCWDDELRQQYDMIPSEAARMIHRDGPLRRGYLRLSRSLAAPSGRNLFAGEDMIVSNSRWTADLMERKYGVVDRHIVYPPVLAEFPDVPAERKEFGFVCLGRIAHEKRIERIIEILGRVRALGHDIHLHLIGPIDDSPYGRMVRGLVEANRSWITPEGRKTGADKARLLTGHRFGIHARRGEAFGIAVAEMVKAGCIPFVPDDGGQVEIVDHPLLCYADIDDAVAKIDRVLRDAALQQTLARHLQKQGEQFSVKRFVADFRDVVNKFQQRRSTVGMR